MGQGETVGPYPGWCIAKGRYCCSEVGSWLFPRGARYIYIASLYPRQSVHGEEPHPIRGDPVAQNTADRKEQTLKNDPQSYGVSAVPNG